MRIGRKFVGQWVNAGDEIINSYMELEKLDHVRSCDQYRVYRVSYNSKGERVSKAWYCDLRVGEDTGSIEEMFSNIVQAQIKHNAENLQRYLVRSKPA